MGLVGRRRRPPLPAPTDSSLGVSDHNDDSHIDIDDDNGNDNDDRDVLPPRFTVAPSDLETNLTTRTDKTHWSIPEDGSPVVIRADKLRLNQNNTTLKGLPDANSSQASLLIEYFEDESSRGPGGRKPSIRVRITPSTSKRRAATAPEGLTGAAAATAAAPTTAAAGSRHRSASPISNASDVTAGPIDAGPSGIGSSIRGNLHGDEVEESRLDPLNMSEISSMPADSLLASELAAAEPPIQKLNRRRSRSLEREADAVDTALLKPSPQRSRSLSRERLVAKKALEKFEREARERKKKEREREGKPRRKSRSASNEYIALTSSGKPHRKSSRSYDKDDGHSSPSPLAESAVSGVSAQSAQTTSSISKNPKLLQTVEDAIRRLILPEIAALKNEQRSSRRSERRDEDLSSNASSTRGDSRSSRRVSGSGSGTGTGKSGPKLRLNGDTIKSSRSSRRSGDGGSVDSLKREFERGASEETVIRDGKTRRRSKDKTKELALGAAAAGLTYEALKSKDSASSIERRERRRKRSKSHSRSQSRADSVEEVFNKHDVPPMPMAGGLTDSDLTRDSILSERTSTPTHERNREVRDFVRDSAADNLQYSSEVPYHSEPETAEYHDTANIRGTDQYGEGVHLKKESLGNRWQDEFLEEDDLDEYGDEDMLEFSQGHYMPMTSMYSGANYGNSAYRYQRRGLSPIQSVASFEERGEPPPSSLQHQESVKTRSSVGQKLHPEESMDSVSSGTAHKIHRKSLRPKSVNMENASDTLHGHNTPHQYDDAQDVRQLGANAEYIDSPQRPESAVASLMEPSIAENRSNLSYDPYDQVAADRDYSHHADLRRDSLASLHRNLHTPDRSSPLKSELRHDDFEEAQQSRRHANMTPLREERGYSNNSSPFDARPKMQSSALPTGSPMPEIGLYDDELETNPSEIRDDPWDHKGAQHSSSAHDSLQAAAKNMLLAAGAVGAGVAMAQHKQQESGNRYDDLNSPRHSESPGLREVADSPSATKKTPGLSPWVAPDFTPLAPLGKDEGYASGAPGMAPPSDGSITPEPKVDSKPTARGLFQDMDMSGDVAGDDPFTTPAQRPGTAGSDGMPSPLFDASTGHGLDRIKNQDIVALMDHLTVRDAQRNARDTEILVTLVRSAAEMRNSFEGMKRIMSAQEARIIDSNNKQHTETRRAINGPRAMPPGKPIGSRAASDAEMNPEDIPAKRRNIFRKALRGLGGGTKQDLGNIENMLLQLLDEVAEIRAVQQMPNSGDFATPMTAAGLTSYEQLRDVPQPGTEVSRPAEAAMGKSNDSGYSSTASSYQMMQHQRRISSAVKPSPHRVSTVHEDDEEDEGDDLPLDEHEQRVLGNDHADALLTPTRDFRSASLDTGAPQAMHQQSLSVDNTPSRRKDKTGSSTFYAKISRWSKTTASTVPGLDQTPRRDSQAQNTYQNTPPEARNQRPVSEISRSASDLNEEYDVREHYDPHGDDRLRSKTSLSNNSASREARPPSPLIPSTVSERPTYSAHRDSKDLQHPQPRQGPTARFQNHLENEAQEWLHAGNVDSPNSDVLGANPVLSRFAAPRDRSERVSYASTGGQGAEELGTIVETASSQGPPRPPKIKDEGPLLPLKSHIEQGPADGRTVQFANDRLAHVAAPQGRKPSGPRPITRTGSASPAQGQNFADWQNASREQNTQRTYRVPSDDESETF